MTIKILAIIMSFLTKYEANVIVEAFSVAKGNLSDTCTVVGNPYQMVAIISKWAERKKN